MEAMKLHQYDEWIADHLDELVIQYAGKVVAIDERTFNPSSRNRLQESRLMEVFRYKPFRGRLTPIITVGVRIGAAWYPVEVMWIQVLRIQCFTRGSPRV